MSKVTYPEEIRELQGHIRNYGFDNYTDEQVELMWRRYSNEFLCASFAELNRSAVDEFLLWGGFREPDNDWERDKVEMMWS